MMTNINIQNLSIKLSRKATIEIENLIIKPGTIVGILGANGSGKTTLLKTIAGHVTPSSGIRIVSGSIGWKGPRLPGYCPFLVDEVLALHPGRKAPEFVTFDPIAHFDLGHLLKRSLSNLSTGEQHRSLLARLFCNYYDNLILDEPLTGLDPYQQFQLGTALVQYKAYGGTVLLASHSPDWVTLVCDSTYALINHRLRPIDLANMSPNDIRGIYAPHTI